MHGIFPKVKVCDFGISQIVRPDLHDGQRKALMKHKCGSLGYMAPEVKQNNQLIGPEIDMWAFGVLLYEFCTAYKPTQVRKFSYSDGPIPFVKRDWQRFDEEYCTLVQELIQKCLTVEPEKRLTAAEALQHDWFKLNLTEN